MCRQVQPSPPWKISSYALCKDLPITDDHLRHSTQAIRAPPRLNWTSWCGTRVAPECGSDVFQITWGRKHPWSLARGAVSVREGRGRSCSSGLLFVLVVLTPLAHASLPDPAWIPGIYDGADFDGIVVAVASTTGLAVGSTLLAMLIGIPDPRSSPSNYVAQTGNSAEAEASQGVCRRLLKAPSVKVPATAADPRLLSPSAPSR